MRQENLDQWIQRGKLSYRIPLLEPSNQRSANVFTTDTSLYAFSQGKIAFNPLNYHLVAFYPLNYKNTHLRANPMPIPILAKALVIFWR